MRGISLIALMTLGGGAFGYDAAPPVSFAKPSANGKYVFVMLTPNYDAEHATRDERTLRRKYSSSGMYTSAEKPDLLWAVNWYSDNVHPGNDGVSLVSVNDIKGYWLGGRGRSENLAIIDKLDAVSFYKGGKVVRNYKLGELLTTSRFTDDQLEDWFHWLTEAKLDDAAGTITIEAVTGEKVVVNVRSGEIVERDKPGRPVILVAAVAVVVVMGALAVFVFAALPFLRRRPRKMAV